MNDQKTISKLQNHYLTDSKFRSICRSSSQQNISWFNFFNHFLLFSDLKISEMDLFCFLAGIKNHRNIYNDYDFLSNKFYFAGKTIAREYRRVELIENMKRFGFTDSEISNKINCIIDCSRCITFIQKNIIKKFDIELSNLIRENWELYKDQWLGDNEYSSCLDCFVKCKGIAVTG